MNTTTEVESLLPLVERLGGPDWRASGEAYGALVAAGEAGRARRGGRPSGTA